MEAIEVKDRCIKLFGPGGDSIPTRQFPDFILWPPRSQSSRYTWPTSVTQKRVPTFLVNSRKRGFPLLTPKIPPSTFEWTFPEHSILVESALRKETPISPGRAKGILSILLLIYYSRHQLIDAGS